MPVHHRLRFLTSTVALTLLLAALVLAPMWDRAIFMQALREALSRDAQLMQSLEAPADSSAGPETNVRHVVSDSAAPVGAMVGGCRLWSRPPVRHRCPRHGAGGSWIRTFSSAVDRQRFRGFVRV